MEKLEILKFQAESIETALRLAAINLDAHSMDTCAKRDIMQAWQMIKNVLAKDINQHVSRL